MKQSPEVKAVIRQVQEGVRELTDHGIRCYPRVRVGRYELSVQASSFHYSSPRADRNKLSEYTEVEVAVLDAEGIDYRWTGWDVGGYYSWPAVARLVDRLLRDDPEYPFTDDRHSTGACFRTQAAFDAYREGL